MEKIRIPYFDRCEERDKIYIQILKICEKEKKNQYKNLTNYLSSTAKNHPISHNNHPYCIRTNVKTIKSHCPPETKNYSYIYIHIVSPQVKK